MRVLSQIHSDRGLIPDIDYQGVMRVLKQIHRDRDLALDLDDLVHFCAMCGEPWSAEVAQEVTKRAVAGKRDDGRRAADYEDVMQVLKQRWLDRDLAPGLDDRSLFCEMCGEPWSDEVAQEIMRKRTAADKRGSTNTAAPDEPPNDTPQGIRDKAAFLEEAGDGVRCSTG